MPTGADLGKIVEGYRLILDGLGVDCDSPHFKESPFRAAKAMANELCKGLWSDPPDLTVFPLKGPPTLVISRGIPVRSLCAHHLLPFTGEAAVGYIPNKKMVGLSKLSRVVEYFARRPQVQEELSNDIADYLYKVLEADGVGVVIESKHFCMELRGVNHPSNVVTSAIRGEFNSPEVRAEFLSLRKIV